MARAVAAVVVATIPGILGLEGVMGRVMGTQCHFNYPLPDSDSDGSESWVPIIYGSESWVPIGPYVG